MRLLGMDAGTDPPAAARVRHVGRMLNRLRPQASIADGVETDPSVRVWQGDGSVQCVPAAARDKH